MPLEPPVGEFNLSRLERVIYGPGKIAALKDEMERREVGSGGAGVSTAAVGGSLAGVRPFAW